MDREHFWAKYVASPSPIRYFAYYAYLDPPAVSHHLLETFRDIGASCAAQGSE